MGCNNPFLQSEVLLQAFQELEGINKPGLTQCAASSSLITLYHLYGETS